LDILRSFFLLARGELFQEFIEEADTFLNKPPNAATEYDIRQCFVSTIRKLLADDEDLVAKIKVELNLPKVDKNNKDVPKKTGWELLSLSYNVPWPLHLIISPNVLTKYNDVFRFLLLAKRTQLLLHKAWTDQKHDKVNSIPNHCSESWQLRCHMMFVVDNLQYYLMADVLESQFSLLLERLKQSTNFEELRHSHDIFLSSVISNTFVNNKPVNQCLTELLQCCIAYCQLVEYGQGDQSGPKLEEISVNFSRQSSWLFKLLTSIKGRQTGSQLAQLLLRIDYNRYFSTYGHDIGIRATANID
jgi:gamma-tubulin complex component 4